jgi:hypothetical protein
MNKISLSLSNTVIPVELETETSTGKTKQIYELREMSAAGRDRYLDALSERMRTSVEGKTTVKKFEGMHADLLTNCLFDHAGKAVPRETIQSWPASAITTLFDAAQDINRLGEKKPSETTEEIKNA